MQEKKLLMPVEISRFFGKSKAFLTRQQAEALKEDLAFLNENWQARQLTTPNGIKLKSRTVDGREIEIFSHYVHGSDFLIKKFIYPEYNQAVSVRKKLIKRGIPVEAFLQTFHDRSEGTISVLIRRTHPSLASFDEYSKVDRGNYFAALSVLHALKQLHGHPHIRNTFKDIETGKIGFFDFGNAHTVKVNWKSAKSIYDAFFVDYAEALRYYGMGEENRENLLERAKRRDIDDIVAPLTHHLPIDKDVRQKLVEKLKDFVCPIIESLTLR